jgi:hypothetical protein
MARPHGQSSQEPTNVEAVTDNPRPERASDILLTEVAKLQSDAEYAKRDLGETRADMRDLRDRMARLEVRVEHLPSKGFIVVVVTTSLLIATGIATLAPKLWAWAGTPIVTAPTSK